MTAMATEPESGRNKVSALRQLSSLIGRPLRRFGALRSKTLLLLGASVLGLLCALYIPLRLIVLRSFLDLEASTTRTEVERAHDALQTAITKLDNSTTGYATWDDTYAFVQDHNPRYLDVDLAEPSFPAEDINLALIVNSDGQMIGAKAYDLIRKQSVSVPPFFLQPAILRSSLFRVTTVGSSVSGFVVLPEGIMLVASRPILTSDNRGPVRGTMLMGRWLDPELVQRIADSTHLQLSIYTPNDTRLPDVARSLQSLDSINTQTLSRSSMVGITQLRDVFGQPGIYVLVAHERTIYAQGVTAVTYFTSALIIVTLVSLLVTGIGLERLVLARVARMSTRVHTIGASGDISLRLKESGNDELARLSLSINEMLAALEHAQTTRWQAEEVRAHTQEELLRSREQFSQMLVHDLKNPLTGVKGYLDLLNRTRLDAIQLELVEGAYRSTANTLALVTQLLDIARMQEGRLEVRREQIDIEVLLEDCMRELQPWADAESKSMVVAVAPWFPAISLDISLMRRVLVNLVSNAIKHTKNRTEIVLGAEIDGAHARIFVSDNGQGIADDFQQRIFQRFNSAAGINQVQSNTGLGLAFCKLAVEAHGGTISVISAPNQGTMFVILLPLPAPLTPSFAPLPSEINTLA